MLTYNNIDDKLKAFCDQECNVPFQYGVDDCSRFAAKWVKDFSGRTVIEDWPEYTDENSAIIVLASMGYDSQEEALDHFFKRIPKTRLMRGGLVGHYFPNFGLMAVGVFMGDSAVFKSPDGIYMLPYKKIDRNLCWSIE
mgnify:CR=1 FL=1